MTRLSFRARLGLGALSGVLYFVAFPGTVGVWPVAFAAMIPLSLALDSVSVKQGLFIGWFTGCTAAGLGFLWLVPTLMRLSGFGLFPCLGLYVVFVLYQGLSTACIGGLTALLDRFRFSQAIAFPFAFALGELVFPFLLPFTYSATIYDVPELIQIADIGGQSLLTWMLVACNVSLLALFRWIVKRQSFPVKRLLIHALPGVALLVCSIGYAQYRGYAVAKAVHAAPKVKLGVIQAGVDPFQKHLNPEETVEHHVELTAQLIREQKPDVVIWSESAVMTPLSISRIKRYLSSHFKKAVKRPVVLGMQIEHPEDSRRFTNSVVIAAPDGYVCPSCRYDKQVLIPFIERFTVGEISDQLADIGHAESGGNTSAIPLGKHVIAAFICYEALFPNLVRRIVNEGNAELLVNLSNDGWFGDSPGPKIHLALARLRAVEHHRFLIRGTTSGYSAVIDPLGRVVWKSGLGTSETTATTVAWLTSTTVFGIVGNVPWYVAVVLLCIVAIFRRRGRG